MIIRLNNLKTKIAEIGKLKNQLKRTDYKIIKAYEYQLAGLETPYDIEMLHSEREALRAEIRNLEVQANDE